MSYSPPPELGRLFEAADAIQGEYQALHKELHPGIIRAALGHLGVVRKPDWDALNARLHRLEPAARAALGEVEDTLKARAAAEGGIPVGVKLRYHLFVAAVNCIIVVRAMRDTLEADRAPIQVMIDQQRQYREARWTAALRAASYGSPCR